MLFYFITVCVHIILCTRTITLGEYTALVLYCSSMRIELEQ